MIISIHREQHQVIYRVSGSVTRQDIARLNEFLLEQSERYPDKEIAVQINNPQFLELFRPVRYSVLPQPEAPEALQPDPQPESCGKKKR